MAAALPNSGDTEPLLIFFFIFHVFGWSCSLIMLLTVILSSKVSRNKTWINLCLSWILACFSFSFLLISGQLGKLAPQRDVCLFQASMIYAVPTLTAGATLSLAIHTWTIVRNSVRKESMQQDRNYEPNRWGVYIRNIILVAWTYIAPIALLIGVFAFGVQNRELVGLAPHGLYCGVKDPIPGKVAAVYIAVVMVPTLVFEGLIISALYSNWRSYAIRQVSGLSTMIRLGTFTIVGIFSIGISLSYLSGGTLGRLPNVLQALPPVTFVIVFSSQRDIMRALTFYYETPLSKYLKSVLTSGTSANNSIADTSTTMDFSDSASTKVTVTTMTTNNTDLRPTPSISGYGDDVEKYSSMKPLEVPRPF